MDSVITFELTVAQLVGLAFLAGIGVLLLITLPAYKFDLIKLIKDKM